MAPAYGPYDFFSVTLPSEYVAQVEVNRPKKLNAFTGAMFKTLGSIFRQLSHDPAVRVVILTAVGDRAFTAGLDVQDASDNGGLTQSDASDAARRATLLRRHIQEIQDEVTAIEKCEKPIVAVMHGISYGLAIDMTTCCDVRFCTKDTRFSVREVEIGLAADVGTLSRLPKSGVSMSFAKDVALSARDWYADEALRVGYVSAVFESKKEALEKAQAWAASVATKSPVAVQGTKEVINFSRDHSVEDGKFPTPYMSTPLLMNLQASTTSKSGTPRCCRRKTSKTPCSRAYRSASRSFQSCSMQCIDTSVLNLQCPVFPCHSVEDSLVAVIASVASSNCLAYCSSVHVWKIKRHLSNATVEMEDAFVLR